MRDRPFKQMDVFTRVPFLGNPVAVVLEGEGLGDRDMQAIARWTNLSETVFVLPSTRADYTLRIFTPVSELPFAGHPTIGAAHAAREAGIVPESQLTFAQECAAGPVPLVVEPDGAIRARVPRPRRVEIDLDLASLSAALGEAQLGEPMAVHVGPVWLVARVGPAALYALSPSMAALAALSRATGTTGVTLYAIVERDPAPEVHVRSFAPADGISEDPVCGSGNAAVAAHLRMTHSVERVGSRYVARQGRAVNRDGYVSVSLDHDDVWIGGHAVTVISGTMSTP